MPEKYFLGSNRRHYLCAQKNLFGRWKILILWFRFRFKFLLIRCSRQSKQKYRWIGNCMNIAFCRVFSPKPFHGVQWDEKKQKSPLEYKIITSNTFQSTQSDSAIHTKHSLLTRDIWVWLVLRTNSSVTVTGWPSRACLFGAKWRCKRSTIDFKENWFLYLRTEMNNRLQLQKITSNW